MFLVICYAIHSREVASIDTFPSYEEALKFLKEDAEKTCKEEGEDAVLDIDNDADTAEVTIYGDSFVWTWSIHELPAAK